MATSIDRVRVICTKCPAEARIHYQQVVPFMDAMLAWIECHGEHRFVRVENEQIMAGEGEVYWKRLHDEDVQRQFEEWESRLVVATERLETFRRFVEATKR